jgi:tetratricopeptide (TPR) repeat protein
VAPDAAPPPAGGPFGLDGPETARLAELCAEAAAPLGVDGARLVAEIGRGRPLGEALGLPAGLAEALYARAHTWFAAGRHDRAEALFRAVCALDGRSADAWIGYGVCLRLRGAGREAGLAVATAVALRPDWALARVHAAGLAAATGEWDLAARHLAAFAACDGPDTPSDLRREAAQLGRAMAQRQGQAR